MISTEEKKEIRQAVSGFLSGKGNYINYERTIQVDGATVYIKLHRTKNKRESKTV